MGAGYHGGFGGTKGKKHHNKLYAIPFGGADYMSKTDLFSINIKKRKDIDANGFYDIVAHGSMNSIKIENDGKAVIINHRVAAKLFKKDNKYQGQSIRLLSCNTGASEKGFAQNLANKLNVVVEAPTKLVWAYPNGKYIVADRRKDNPNQPDLSRMGRFVKYYPGGKR